MYWRGCGAGGRELVVGCIEGDVVVMESAGDDVVMVMCCRSMACGAGVYVVQLGTMCNTGRCAGATLWTGECGVTQHVM